MFGKGHFLILAGITCIVAPGAAHLYATYFMPEDTAPHRMLTKNQAEESCVKDSVQIAGVWVGCKAAASGQKEKQAPRKLQMNSSKGKAAGSSGSLFIKVN